jgi:hypothetical protein
LIVKKVQRCDGEPVPDAELAHGNNGSFVTPCHGQTPSSHPAARFAIAFRQYPENRINITTDIGLGGGNLYL